MKLFIDTNIFVEYFEKRAQFESVRILFDMLEDRVHTGYISVGSFYTIAYIVDQGFKRKGIQKPERLSFVRSVLLKVLDLVEVIGNSKEELLNGVNDLSFTDLEDSFQYQVSLSGSCDCIITINIKDFKGISNSMKVYTPQQFLEKYSM